MKRLIFATIVLLIATALVTTFYFKNLSSTTQHTSQVMRTIPDDASLIFEFNNDKDFYDIFTGNKLFTALIGQDKLTALTAVRNLLLLNPALQPYTQGQNIFASLHPQKGNTIDFLLTVSIARDFDADPFLQLAKNPKSGMLVTEINLGGKPGYVIYLSELKKRFYLVNKDDRILSGSFSKELVENYARYDYRKEKPNFVLLPDQQSKNSLANLYVNYQALSPLFAQVFHNKNIDIFRNFRQLNAFAAMSLNYKTDAFMFNGVTELPANNNKSYLGLFNNQEPAANLLKEIFPSTTAYFTSFSVSDPGKFGKDLSNWQSQGDQNKETAAILAKVKGATGIKLQNEFAHLLSNEFALVTTRYHEKIAIIQVSDGSKAKTLMTNISKMNTDDTGQFNYDKLPQILLGEAFTVFKRPYFKVMDNYLVLANTLSEIASYTDSYANHKFLNKTDGYGLFNELLAERSNVSFFIHFKNALQLFREDMKPAFYEAFENTEPGWKNFYGACWQFTSSDKNYYTNFCMRLSSDTTAAKEAF